MVAGVTTTGCPMVLTTVLDVVMFAEPRLVIVSLAARGKCQATARTERRHGYRSGQLESEWSSVGKGRYAALEMSILFVGAPPDSGPTAAAVSVKVLLLVLER